MRDTRRPRGLVHSLIRSVLRGSVRSVIVQAGIFEYIAFKVDDGAGGYDFFVTFDGETFAVQG